jgi:hypothetical protein
MSTRPNGSLRSRHIGELTKDLSRDFSRLVRLEVELAKAEARELADDLRSRAQRTASEAQGELQSGRRRVGERLAAKGKQAGAAAGLFAGAALFALGTFGALTAFLILVLDEAMPAWAAALLVLGVYAATAALLGVLGRNRWRRAMPLLPAAEIRETADGVRQAFAHGKDRFAEAMPPVPQQTIETVKEDIEWAKHPTRSVERSKTPESG